MATIIEMLGFLYSYKVCYKSLCGKDLEGVGEVENDVEYVEGSPGYEEGEGHQHQHEVRPLAPLQLTRPP
jgi:hypothetical protein